MFFLKWFIIINLFLSSLVFFYAEAEALEAGFYTGNRQIGRQHSDSDSIGSEIKIYTNRLHIKDEFGSFTFFYNEEREIFQLGHPDGTLYFKSVLEKHRPKVSYNNKFWKANLSITNISVNKTGGFYRKIEADNKNNLNLWSLSGEIPLASFFIGSSQRLENDFFAFNYHRYSIFLYQIKEYYFGYKIDKDKLIKITNSKNDRYYPKGYELPKNKNALFYQWNQPLKLGNNLSWNYLQINLSQTEILKTITQEHYIENLFTFKLAGFKHFVSYRITYNNWLTTYRQGQEPYSLIEEYWKLNDISHKLVISAFRKIGRSNLYFTYSYQLKDSLVKQVSLDQTVNFKLTYNFR